MPYCFRALAVAVCVGLVASLAPAQETPTQPPKPRRFAPGVVTVIPIETENAETMSGPRPAIELTVGRSDLDWSPNTYSESRTLQELAKDVTYRRSIWNLEFAFKPLRMLEVDVPQPSGKMQKKLIWYMVYRVKNLGGHLVPEASTDEFGNVFYSVKKVDYPVRFIPHIVLQSHPEQGVPRRAYLDRIIPVAKERIRMRETPNRRLLDSAEMMRQRIPVSTEEVDNSVWGVVTWEDIDPRIDFFSIYIRGLSNAYKFDDPEGAYQASGEPGNGRTFERKTLQLNFWRPGDIFFEKEEEIRYGIPLVKEEEAQQRINLLYGVEKPVDHKWIYR